MRNNFVKLCALSILLFTVSCNEDSNNQSDNIKTELVSKNSGLSKFSRTQQEQIAKDFFKNLTDKNNNAGKPRGFCHDFTVHVNIGIFEVETEVTICCTTLTMNCHPIPKTVIHRNANDPDIKEFEVVESSIYTNEDGENIRIKPGIYKVAEDNTVQFELEDVK